VRLRNALPMKGIAMAVAILLLASACILLSLTPPTPIPQARSAILDLMGDYILPERFYIGYEELAGPWRALPASLEEGLKAGIPNLNSTGGGWREAALPLRLEEEAATGLWLAVTFELPKSLGGRHYHLFFELAAVDCYVWMNGHYIGIHRASPAPFTLEVTRHIYGDGPNILVLYLDPRHRLPGYEVVIGEVGLYSTGDVQVRAILARVVEAGGGSATLKVDVVLENLVDSPLDVELSYELSSSAGSLGRGSTRVKVPEQRLSLHSFTVDVANPPLWYPMSSEKAQLCVLRLEVFEGELLGGTEVRLGLRSLSSEGGRLLVNGEPVFLRGIAVRGGEAGGILRLLAAGNTTFNFLHLLEPTELLSQLARECDERGVLLAVSLEEEPRLQLAYMLLLYSHPSFALWIEEGTVAGINGPWAGAEVAIYSLKPPTAKPSYVAATLDYRPILRREEVFVGALDEALQQGVRGDGYLLEAAVAGTVRGQRRAVSMWMLANRLRAGKFKPLAGFSLMTAVEELPWIRDQLRPLTPLLELGGDYAVTEDGLELNPAPGIYLRVGVANDDPAVRPGRCAVGVEVWDVANGSLVSTANVTVNVTSQDEAYGERVLLKMKVPPTPQRRVYELRVSMLEGGGYSATVSVRAYVVPERLMRIRFTGRVEGVLVVNASQGASKSAALLVIRVSGDEAVIRLAGAEELTVIGPFSTSEPIVPYSARFNLSGCGPELSVEWPLELGSRLVFEVVPPLHEPAPKLSLHAIYTDLSVQPPPAPFTRLSPEEQLNLAERIPELYFAAGSVTLPSGEAEVSARYVVWGRERELTRRIHLGFNETLVIPDIADTVFGENERILRNLKSGVEALVESLEDRGYYLGGSRYMLSLAEELISRARGGDRLSGAALQRQAYTLLSQLNSHLMLLSGGPGLWYTTFIVVAELALSLLVGWVMFTRRPERLASSLALFTSLMVLSSQLLPGLRMGVETAAAMAVAAGLMLTFVMVARSPGLSGLRTASGASLEGILTSMVGFSVNLLSRRRLRATLLLATVTAVSAGITSLTSFTAYSSVSYQLLGQPPRSVEESYLIVAAESPTGPLNPAGLSALEGREEVEGVALSAVAMYPMNPLDVIGGVPVAGILGISSDSPLAGLMREVASPPTAVEVVGSSQGFILISDSMARALGREVGEVLVLRGEKYVVAGYFDSGELARIRDLDGGSVIPPVIIGYISTQVSSESVVVMNYRDALKLGAAVNKVYVKVKPGAACEELAQALSVIGGYEVYVAMPGGNVKVYFPSLRFELRGAEMVVPAAISILIVFSAFVGFSYEMRRDVFTLSTLGATPSQLFLLFLVEAGLMGFAGGVAGYVAGLAAFKLFGALGILVPVDVKLSIAAAAGSVVLPIAISVLGALVPASRAVTMAVPSLRRRWTPEAELLERREAERTLSFRVPIPVVIGDEEKARSLVEHMVSRLAELSSHKVSVYNVDAREDRDEWGRRRFSIYFEYAQVEGRAFKSHNTIWVRWSGDQYVVEMDSEVTTIFTLFANECLRDVTSLVREIALEWSAEGERVAALIYESRSIAKEVVGTLNPRYLLILTRGDPERLEALLRYTLGGTRHRLVLDVRQVKFRTLREAVKELKKHLADVDAVYINSDDALLSAAALLAAMKLSKRILAR